MSAARPSLFSRIYRFFAERLWARILLFAVVSLPPIVGVTLGPVVLMHQANSQLKSSEAYRASLEIVRRSSRVREAVGEPIDPEYWANGMMNVDGDDRYTAVRYDVTGPKGKSTIEFDADYADGAWKLREVKADVEPGRPFVRIWPTIEDDVQPQPSK